MPSLDPLLAGGHFLRALHFQHSIGLMLTLGFFCPGFGFATTIGDKLLGEQEGIFQLLIFLFALVGHHILYISPRIGIIIEACRGGSTA